RLLGPCVLPVLSDPLFELLQDTIGPGRGHYGLHMVDQDCRSPPLGDGAFWRVVRVIDIEQGQRTEHRVREAGGREGCRFSREEFEGSVGSNMDDDICPEYTFEIPVG